MKSSVHPAAFVRAKARGFTLVELMITLSVLAVVVIALAAIVQSASRSRTSSSNNVESMQSGRIAVDMIAKDIRSAGYGADLNSSPAQLPIAYVDSLQLILNENLRPYPDSLAATKAAPLAYNPAGNPKPFPLNGTSWQPPLRYLTGAECVRWTLDVNNDGAVDNGDISGAEGVDAMRTRNPNDYILARQVYGDSTGLVAGNNGGTVERISLIARPGGGVPPLFTVYLSGSADPWDWANGPVPLSQLPNITRVRVNVVAQSAKPDWRGQYSRTEFKTDVSSMRNVPDMGTAAYDVDGYIYNDMNKNNVKNAGEAGLSNVVVRLGAYNTTTDANGYYYLRAPAGTYTLRQVATPGYGVFTYPDSFVVTLGPDATRSFADTARAGGTVTCFAYEDKNGNLAYDTGEPPISNTKFQMSPTNQVAYADTGGRANLFAPTGTFSVASTAPDSFLVMSANPVSGNMTTGGTAAVNFALQDGGFGFIEGTAFLDGNRNGVLDGGEQGMANVWVGVTNDGGVTVPGYAYTNASGSYSIKVPTNDPPRTTAYAVMCVPSAGFYPTSTTNIGSLWVQNGQTYPNNNFGMSSFQIITLNASRVLSLASVDAYEKDWPGTSTNLAHADADILLGADAAGTDQVSVWFNQYNSTPLFNTTPTYSRSAPQSVMAMAVDTLDGSTPKNRPDLVTGTKVVAAGNFFVWFSQNTSGNEGYLPATYSSAQNYKTTDQGDVQAVLTYDCAGGAGSDYPDIIVGTKSPTVGKGSIEVWKSSNAATPVFTREEVYPPASGMAVGSLGEVTCMTLADLDNDGKRDLVVGTKTAGYSGQVVFFKALSKTTSPHFLYMSTVTLSSDAVTSITSADVNGDGKRDVVIGTQRTDFSGKMIYLRNVNPATFNFNTQQTVDAPGIVTSLLTADFGGTAAQDIAMGFRESNTSYLGGVRIYYLDYSGLPVSGSDPSAGAVVNMVPAVTTNNFNFGANPSPAAPFLADLAAGIKSSATTGALVVFVR